MKVKTTTTLSDTVNLGYRHRSNHPSQVAIRVLRYTVDSHAVESNREDCVIRSASVIDHLHHRVSRSKSTKCRDDQRQSPGRVYSSYGSRQPSLSSLLGTHGAKFSSILPVVLDGRVVIIRWAGYTREGVNV